METSKTKACQDTDIPTKIAKISNFGDSIEKYIFHPY